MAEVRAFAVTRVECAHSTNVSKLYICKIPCFTAFACHRAPVLCSSPRLIWTVLLVPEGDMCNFGMDLHSCCIKTRPRTAQILCKLRKMQGLTDPGCCLSGSARRKPLIIVGCCSSTCNRALQMSFCRNTARLL